ncbi:10944_t:CDS:2, partial [Scutellospora calospora]
MNPELMPNVWINTTQKRRQVEKKRREIEKECRGGRFWRPFTFYFCGFGGEFVKGLFRNELFEKENMKKNGNTWWNRYEGQDIVLLENFHKKVGWDNIVNILNNTEYSVEMRYGKFEYFLAKYIFITDIKLPQETYNFNDKGWENWSQFERRLDYIIEFKDNKFIFHKGDKEKFLNMKERCLQKILMMFKKYTNIEKFQKKNPFFTVYIYGPPGIGKTNFVEKVFERCHKKSDKGRNGSNWWNGYKNQKIVLLEEIETKIDWNDLVNLLEGDKHEIIEKFGIFKPFVAKYIFMTSVKSLNESLEFNDLFHNLYQLIDYIIEFDNQGKVKVHKGDKEKFFNMEWDVECNNNSFSRENKDFLK